MGDPPLVLVVDDEPNFCRILDAKLRRSGFDVRIAHTRSEALDAATQRRYDLILLDLNLAEGSGLDLVPSVRGVSIGAPIILMTAYEDEHIRPRALGLGVSEVLYKPFDLDRLIEVVWLHIRHAAATAPLASSVELGQAVVLELADGEKREVSGHVVDKRPNTFQVVPDRPLVPLVGARVRVCVPGEDGLYHFRSTIVGQAPGRGILSLSKPGVIYRRQRRRHLRVPVSQAVALKLVTGTARVPGGKPLQPPDAARPSAMTGEAQDVSAGGMAIVALHPMTPGATVGISWHTGAGTIGDLADARGVVVGCVPASTQEHEMRKRLSVRFTQLSQPARSYIQSLVDSLSPV